MLCNSRRRTAVGEEACIADRTDELGGGRRKSGKAGTGGGTSCEEGSTTRQRKSSESQRRSASEIEMRKDAPGGRNDEMARDEAVNFQPLRCVSTDGGCSSDVRVEASFLE